MTVAQLDYKQALGGGVPFLWLNPNHRRCPGAVAEARWTMADIEAAERRFQASGKLLGSLFSDTCLDGDVIESVLQAVDWPAGQVQDTASPPGHLWIKCDHQLPIAGSIKARGGLHEVIAFAEELVSTYGFEQSHRDFSHWSDSEIQSLFNEHTIVVASTGNLGLSVGLIAKALGFKAVVHMSVEAKSWKKEKLRGCRAIIVEHDGDYTEAVRIGREAAERDPKSYFVDDENSPRLFLGYAVAALRLQRQLARNKVRVDRQNPLFVYVPCGVGGAPGGICFGLHQVFGENVHVFFSEPTQSACMLLALSEGEAGPRAVYDIGLDNTTVADGLAVSRASAMVANIVKPLVSGIYTVSDEILLRNLYLLKHEYGFSVEPSAAAGLSGSDFLLNTDAGSRYLKENTRPGSLARSNHVVWTTGGMHLPRVEYEHYWSLGRAIDDNAI